MALAKRKKVKWKAEPRLSPTSPPLEKWVNGIRQPEIDVEYILGFATWRTGLLQLQLFEMGY